ncbi:MAG: mannitol-1-phosphate 5-dehydrogenase [Candidatus Firestonebacteria bacterium]
MKKLIQFGAGNIGRGFIAQLFTESRYEVVFVDIDKKIIDALNKEKKYTLEILGKKNKKISITNVRAVNGTDIDVVAGEIQNADIIATAVGVNVIKSVCPAIAEGIRYRAENKIELPVNIIICENLLSAGKILKEYIKSLLEKKYIGYLDKYVGFVETVIGRMIPVLPDTIKKKDLLYVKAEEYSILPVAKKGFKGEIPDVKNMIACDNFKFYEERKLFIHNLGHAVCAFLGYFKKYKYVWEAIADKNIISVTKKAMNESGDALRKKYNLTKKEIDEYINDLLVRFSNKNLGDTIVRLARDPIRKLGKNDRLIGSAKLALKYGVKPENISLAIAAALHYNYEKDEHAVKLAKIIKTYGVQYVLTNISKLKSKEILTKMIIEKYNKKGDVL